MKALFAVFLVIVAGVGCGSKGKVLGKAPNDPVSTVLAVNAGDAPPRITLEGRMIEKCPQAGCWFRIDDGTGVIKVDTKTAAFVVTQVPLNAQVAVAGRIVHDGSESQIEATGLRY